MKTLSGYQPEIISTNAKQGSTFATNTKLPIMFFLPKAYHAWPKAASMLLLLLTLSSCDSIRSPSSSVTTNTLSISEIEEVIEQEMVRQNIIGLAVAVVEDGEITHTRAYGHLNEERTTPVTTNTVFRYASVSKPITALAVFKAISQGHFSLNDKVVDLVPYWPAGDNRERITVAHLLSHRSGICDYGYKRKTDIRICDVKSKSSNATNSFDAPKSVSRFSHCELVFLPGTDHGYTTYGYDLLGAVIEETTGIDYVTYVNTHIKNVAGMTSLSSSAPSPGGFNFDCDLRRVARQGSSTPIKVPGGGWSSNISDFAKLLKGIVNDQFLTTTLPLWQPVNFPDENGKYIYGFQKESVDGTDYVYHTGKHNDTKTYLGFFPGDRNGICLIMNTGGGDSKRIGDKLLRLMGYSTGRNSRPIESNGGDSDCGDRALGVWRQTNNPTETVLRRELNNSNFLHEVEALANAGWQLVDMETKTYGTNRRWDGIFKKDVSATTFLRDYNLTNFNTIWQQQNDAGRRLIDLEIYKNGSQIQWAGLFQSGQSGTYRKELELSSNAFSEVYQEHRSAGRKLIDVEVIKKNGNWKWSGVWLGTGTTILSRNLDQDQFLDLCRSRIDAGYRLIDVETYQRNNEQQYAGIWEQASEEEKRWFNAPFGYWLNDKHNVYLPDGYELLDLEMY